MGFVFSQINYGLFGLKVNGLIGSTVYANKKTPEGVY